jgi:membrane protease subunit HflC
MARKLAIAATVLLAGLVLFQVLKFASLFIITEREQAVVTRFNKPVRVIVGDISGRPIDELRATIHQSARQTEGEANLRVSQGAGLYFRMPFVESVQRFPDVLLDTDTPPRDVVLADKKKLLIDHFARWYIEDPLLFRIRVGTVEGARGRLDDLIYSSMREELGQRELIEVVRSTNRFIDRKSELELVEGEQASTVQNPMRTPIELGREKIMEAVARQADAMAREMGIRVVDVRIKRADLLQENLEAVFLRMKAERSRISSGYRSEGTKQVDIIQGNTDRQVQVIMAEAKRDALRLQGEGDAEAARIFAEAFESDADFFTFIRSLEVIQNATPDGTELILGVDSSLYSLLELRP